MQAKPSRFTVLGRAIASLTDPWAHRERKQTDNNRRELALPRCPGADLEWNPGFTLPTAERVRSRAESSD